MPLACMHPPPTSRSCNVCKLGGCRPSPLSKTCSSAETRCYWTPSVNDHPLRPAFRHVPCSRPAAPTRSCVHGHGPAAAFLTLQTRPLKLTLAAAGRGRAPPCGFVLNTFDGLKNCRPRPPSRIWVVYALHAPTCSHKAAPGGAQRRPQPANPERIPDAPATVKGAGSAQLK